MFGFGDKNNYNVNWTLRADVTNAIKNLTEYTNAVNRATAATEALQKASRTIKSGRGGGGAKGGTDTAKSTQPSMSNQTPPIVGGVATGGGQQTQQQAGAKGTQKTTSPAGSKGGRGARGRVGVVGGGMKNPLRNTPFYGLMGTMMAYSAISSETKQAAEYANIMTTSRAILKIADDDLGTFEERFDRLGKKVRQIGIETKFTATEVADATRYLAMAGLSMSTIEQSMKPISNLALIADEELGLIADLTTNIMTGYGLSENAMSPVADILTSTMTRSNVNIVELAESYKMSAGYLKSSGIDFAESAAAIGVLGNAGIKATMAGTALRAMAVRFAKPTTEATKTLERLGVTFTETIDTVDGKVNKVKPLVDIFTELRDAGATLEDMQRVFGTIGGNAAINLIANVEEIARIRDANLVAHGSSEAVADAKKNTVLGRWASFTSTISDNFVSAFEAAEPRILQMLDSVIGYIQSPSFANGIRELLISITDLFQGIVKVFSWVAKYFDVLKPIFVGKFIFNSLTNITGGIYNMVSSLKAATAVATGFGVVTGVFAGVAAIAGVAAYETWSFYKANEAAFKAIEDTSPYATKTFDQIAESIEGAVNKARDLKSAIEDMNPQGIEELTGIKSSGFWASLTTNLALSHAQNEEARQIILAGKNEPKVQQAHGKAIKDAGQISRSMIADIGNYTSPSEALIAVQAYSNKHKLSLSAVNPKLYDAYGLIRSGVGEKDAQEMDGTREYISKFNEVIDRTSESLVEYIKAISGATGAWEFAAKHGFSYESVSEYMTRDSKGRLMFKPISDDMSDEEKVALRMGQDETKRAFSALSGALTDIIGEKGKANLFRAMGLAPSFWSLEPDKRKGFNINVNDINDIYEDGDGGGSGGGRKAGLTRSTATPRQVIINIDNMLKIDNVDVDSANKNEVLRDLKDDVVQMLLDAAHETSHSWLDQ